MPDGCRALARHVLRRDTSADVIVVGAGISGAMVADALSDAGLDVLIVDRRPPVSGSTPASTALLQYEIDTPLTHLTRDIGLDRAQRVWRRSRLALDALRERIQHLDIDADVEDRSSLYLDGIAARSPTPCARRPPRAAARASKSPISRRARSRRGSASRAGTACSVTAASRPIRGDWRQAS